MITIYSPLANNLPLSTSILTSLSNTGYGRILISSNAYNRWCFKHLDKKVLSPSSFGPRSPTWNAESIPWHYQTIIKNDVLIYHVDTAFFCFTYLSIRNESINWKLGIDFKYFFVTLHSNLLLRDNAINLELSKQSRFCTPL